MLRRINDKSLLERITQKDPDGLSELYDRYKTMVYSIALNVLGNKEDAEEATLDVFNRIWENAESYSVQKATVKVWLATISRNKSIDMLRRRNVRMTTQSAKWADACLDCMEGADSPEADLDAAETRQFVVSALNQLPENQKEALALAYFKGLAHSEIARILNEPLGTVKTRIRSAMQTLRKILTQDD